MNTQNPPDYRNDTVLPLPMEVKADAWAVDAACSGNPGPMEYQAIDLQTGYQVFHYGPVHGTNNIGEFLAIVHALPSWSARPRRNPSSRSLPVPNIGFRPTTIATPSSSGRRRSGARFLLTSDGNNAYFSDGFLTTVVPI